MARWNIMWNLFYIMAFLRLGRSSTEPANALVSNAPSHYLSNNEQQQVGQVLEEKTLDANHLEEPTKSPTWLDNGNVNNYQNHFDSNVGLNIVKRAPNGFIGMRGKKDTEDADANNWNIDPMNVQNVEYDDELDDWTRPKKSPTGFYGVRGKKLNGINLGNYNNFFQKLDEDQVRELLFQDFLNRLALKNAADNEIAKRAPTGFTGMRGKRPFIDFPDDEITFDPETSNNKRTPTNAFVGVRGKKDVSNHQTFKRSPGENYLSYGMEPRFIDFANKFVAVRGKKNSANNAFYDGSLVNDQQNALVFDPSVRYQPGGVRYFIDLLPSLMYGRNVGNVGYKRTPGGFVGMRGKRPETR